MYVNGIDYHVEVVGQGPSLVLLHGFTGSVESWKSFLEDWARDFQVIMVDILGHGETESPDDFTRYNINRIAADLHDILNQLNIIKAHILGYSMGGRLALTFAVLYPERLHSLILESASPGLRTEEERDKRIEQDNALADFIEENGLEHFVKHWENIPLFATQQILSSSIQAKVREQRLKNNPIGLSNSLRGMGTGKQPSWWDSLSQVLAPVLLLVGEKDQKFYDIGHQMKDAFPNANLQVVPNAGHTIHLEQPELYTDLIKSHIKQFKEGK